MKRLLIAVIAGGLATTSPLTASTQSNDTPSLPAPPKELTKALSKGDGLSKETAYSVTSVDQEYQILKYFRMQPVQQSLISDGKPYDMIEAVSQDTGEKREFWFDISSFFGKMF